MFRSAERTFTTAERTFTTAECTFRNAEHNTETCSKQLTIAHVIQLLQSSLDNYYSSHWTITTVVVN